MTFIYDQPDATYRALPGLSGTEVAKVLDSPAELKWARENRTAGTSAMALGTLTHALVLGQEHLATVSPFDSFRTAKARAWRDAQVDFGMTVVTQDDWDKAAHMAAAVKEHSVAGMILAAPGHSEVTVTGEHKGAPLKGRIDRLPNAGPLVDFKTGVDVTSDGMSRAMGKYGYATQLAHYALLADRLDPPVIIAVRNNGRPTVAVYRIGELTWHVALEATKHAWDIYAECMESGNWTDPYATGVHELDLKPWALDALEDIEEMEF